MKTANPGKTCLRSSRWKFYVHEIAAVGLSKIYNAKETCKPNNRDLNRDWINERIG